jgi:hypothetical protein
VPYLRRLVAGFPLRRPGFEPVLGNVKFVVEKVALQQVFSEYFCFPCQFAFHRLLHNHHHLSSGVGTVGQTVTAVPIVLDLTPREKKSLQKSLRFAYWILCFMTQLRAIISLNNVVQLVSVFLVMWELNSLNSIYKNLMLLNVKYRPFFRSSLNP